MNPSSPKLLKAEIRQSFIDCQNRTLSLFQNLDYATFTAQAHPEFSPVGWHLGHIAYTWELWIISKVAGLPLTMPDYVRLFAVDGLAKADRVMLPKLAEVIGYAGLVKERLLTYLDSELSDTVTEERLWWWLIQHESQHAETVAIVLQLLDQKNQPNLKLKPKNFNEPKTNSEFKTILAGSFIQGNDEIVALDNENSAHSQYLETFKINTRVVTQNEYQIFIDMDGYGQKQWWSASGWQWLQNHQISEPLHWQIFGDNFPVCGISWYEADAYARFAGMRLPTESEWEKSASHLEDQGLVWEWTSTLFHPYPDFVPFPYSGYSSSYFDGDHYVLKGGSWASNSCTARSTFRNWYQPHVRQIFAGLRCVEL